jgi:hypothetical protein
MQPIDHLGTTPLFFGIETVDWSLAQFEEAAHATKALGITSLLIKIADGGNIWYDNVGGWQKVLETVKPILKAVAYTYCYGNKFNAIQEEIAILIAAMTTEGIVIADMEVEFNGRDDWAKQVSDAILPIPGLFGVTTWADPNLQDWQCVIAKLEACVNFWLPQVYSDFLAQQYQTQFAPRIVPYYPVLNLEARHVIKHASEANSPIIALWEYQFITTYAAAIKRIVELPHLLEPTTAVPTSLLRSIKTKVAELEALIAQLP